MASRHLLRTRRLLVCELPPRAASGVSHFISDNWQFHRRWEPYRDPAYFSRSQARRRLRAIARSRDDHAFWLYERETPPGLLIPPPIGSVTLSAIIRGPLQSCFLGYKLDERFVQRGYMREALVAVLEFAFDELGLHRIEANVMPENERSLRLLRFLGFSNEGLAARYLQIQGRWEDHIHMVLLREQWETRRA